MEGFRRRSNRGDDAGKKKIALILNMNHTRLSMGQSQIKPKLSPRKNSFDFITERNNYAVTKQENNDSKPLF